MVAPWSADERACTGPRRRGHGRGGRGDTGGRGDDDLRIARRRQAPRQGRRRRLGPGGGGRDRGHRRRRAAALRALRPARALGGLRAAGRDHAVPWPCGGRSQGRRPHGRLRRRGPQAAPVAAPARGPHRAQAQGARRGGPELRVGDLPGDLGPALRRVRARRGLGPAQGYRRHAHQRSDPADQEEVRRRRRRARAPRPDHRRAEALAQPLRRSPPRGSARGT